jgi:hypothetical protein
MATLDVVKREANGWLRPGGMVGRQGHPGLAGVARRLPAAMALGRR